MFLLWLVTLISEIFFSLIIWSIVILLQISQTLKIFVCLKLLIKFLLDMQTTQISWIQSLILYFSNQIWNNLTIILFILNGECHWTISHLWQIFQFLRNTPKLLWNALTLTFFFYLFFLVLYFFSFEFLFLFLFLFSDNEEACDIAVTWHVT